MSEWAIRRLSKCHIARKHFTKRVILQESNGSAYKSQVTSELIADEDFSMLSKGLFDLAQAFETSLLVSY
jgi:hypothetical protein